MAQLKSSVVQGTLSVTDNISEEGTPLVDKYLGINGKAVASTSADTVPWTGVTNKVNASSSNAGIVSTTAQNFAGTKTFDNDIIVGQHAKLSYSTSGSDNILTISFV